MIAGNGISSSCLITRIVFCIIGILIGITGMIVWATVWPVHPHSFATIFYAGFSGMLATWNLVLHVMHLQDLWRTWLKGLRLFLTAGIVFMVLTSISFVVFLSIAISQHQRMTSDSFYITAIWCGYSTVWGFLLYWHSKKYRNEFADLTALLDF